MCRRKGAGHQRAVGIIAESHNIVVLMLFPLEKGLVDAFDIGIREGDKGDTYINYNSSKGLATVR